MVLSLSNPNVRGSRSGARESLMISPEVSIFGSLRVGFFFLNVLYRKDRDAALAKINALMGTDATSIVKIECVMDGRVKKTLEVRWAVVLVS